MAPIKSTLLPFGLAVVVATAGFTGLSVAQDSQQAKELPYRGPKWEYRALRIADRQQAGSREGDVRARRSSSEDTLNQLGTAGWELVAVRADGGSDPVFYFKRRVGSPPRAATTPRVRRVPTPPAE